MDAPEDALETHEREIRVWLDRLRDRRERLGAIGDELDAADPEELPESVADSLSELLVALEADLDAQIDDLEGDVRMVRDLRETVASVSGEAVADELDDYVETMDGVLEEKRSTVEQLVATTDRLIDRFDRLLAGR